MLTNNINTGNLLGNGVLYLNPGVHFDKVKFTVFVEEFEGARTLVAHLHAGFGAAAADVGTLQRLPKIMSPSIAAELAYTGRRFSAPEAHGFGLVSRLSEGRQALIDDAMALATEIAAKSPPNFALRPFPRMIPDDVSDVRRGRVPHH